MQLGGVTPLHMAADINSGDGVVITKMLLTCLANTDIRALDDGSYLHLNPVFPFAIVASILYFRTNHWNISLYSVTLRLMSRESSLKLLYGTGYVFIEPLTQW